MHLVYGEVVGDGGGRPRRTAKGTTMRITGTRRISGLTAALLLAAPFSVGTVALVTSPASAAIVSAEDPPPPPPTTDSPAPDPIVPLPPPVQPSPTPKATPSPKPSPKPAPVHHTKKRHHAVSKKKRSHHHAATQDSAALAPPETRTTTTAFVLPPKAHRPPPVSLARRTQRPTPPMPPTHGLDVDTARLATASFVTEAALPPSRPVSATPSSDKGLALFAAADLAALGLLVGGWFWRRRRFGSW